MEHLTKFNAVFMIFAIIILVTGFFYFYSPEEPKEEAKAGEPKQVIVVEEIVEEKPVEEIAKEVKEPAEDVKEPKEVIINIERISFEPSGDLVVSPGTKVTWKNIDVKEHIISANHWVFKSEKLYTGDTFSYTFNDLGVYEYVDSIFGTRGKITVKKETPLITGNVVGSNLDGVGAKSSGLVAALLVLVVVYVCFGMSEIAPRNLPASVRRKKSS